MEFVKHKPTKRDLLVAALFVNSPQIENISNVHHEVNRYIGL